MRLSLLLEPDMRGDPGNIAARSCQARYNTCLYRIPEDCENWDCWSPLEIENDAVANRDDQVWLASNYVAS